MISSLTWFLEKNMKRCFSAYQMQELVIEWDLQYWSAYEILWNLTFLYRSLVQSGEISGRGVFFSEDWAWILLDLLIVTSALVEMSLNLAARLLSGGLRVEGWIMGWMGWNGCVELRWSCDVLGKPEFFHSTVFLPHYQTLLIHRMLWKVRFGREKTIILDLEIISPLGMTILLDNPKVYFLRDGSNIQQIRLRCTTSSALSSSGHVSQAANWA